MEKPISQVLQLMRWSSFFKIQSHVANIHIHIHNVINADSI